MNLRDLVSRWSMALGVAVVMAPVVGGCTPYVQPHPESRIRMVSPIPVCTEPIPPPKRKAGGKAVMRSLDPEKWMEVLIPDLDPTKGLNATDLDCTGHYVFANETLRFGLSARGWPRVIDPDELDVRAGPGGVRVLWYRALSFENGDVGGPLALVRAIDDRAEVYGVGSFRGPADSKISPIRMGNEMLIVAEAKRCPSASNCRTIAHFYLLRRGRLLDAAEVDIERVARVPSVGERGLFAEYRLRTDVTYRKNGVHLLEQVRVKIIPYEKSGDRDSDRLLRTVEFSRMLRVQRDTLFSSNESLWERVVGQD